MTSSWEVDSGKTNVMSQMRKNGWLPTCWLSVRYTHASALYAVSPVILVSLYMWSTSTCEDQQMSKLIIILGFCSKHAVRVQPHVARCLRSHTIHQQKANTNIYIYIYTYTRIFGRASRDGQIDRKIDRQIERCIDAYMHRCIDA